jgi:hypothetical protein
MKIVGAIFGFLALAAVFVVWVRIYKSIKGDDSPLFSWSKRSPKQEENSLEEFIASYKRGAVAAGGSMPVTAKSPSAVPPSPMAPSPVVPTTAPVKRDAFISGSVKLAYLTCKAGLRDHHVFAHVQLSVLSTGGSIDPALARGGIDLLICNAALSAVAAIDLVDAGTDSTHAAKMDHLKALGIRYLRLSAKSLPRPDELHALLYKM